MSRCGTVKYVLITKTLTTSCQLSLFVKMATFCISRVTYRSVADLFSALKVTYVHQLQLSVICRYVELLVSYRAHYEGRR